MESDTKNSGTKSMKAAQRAAGLWQAELNSDGVVTDHITEWEEFREDFFDNYVAERSASYGRNVASTFSVIADSMTPDKLNRVTTQWIKRFRTTARKQGKSQATLHKYMQHLRTALKWAHDQDYLKKVPKFPTAQREASKGKKLMKGRPITLEEFERLQAACESDSLNHLLLGLWLSGLRIGEALSLTWDQWADGIRVDIDSDGDVFLLIDGADQKSGEAQLYPVVDDFADFLTEIPPDDRQGFVFAPQGTRGLVSRRVDTVSDWIVTIGEKANVKVDTRKDRKTGKTEAVYASAHDLRRSFGFRWALIVEAIVLRDLMRHASVETTEQFYVGIQAKRMLQHIRSRKKASEVNEQS
jgi:integrase